MEENGEKYYHFKFTIPEHIEPHARFLYCGDTELPPEKSWHYNDWEKSNYEKFIADMLKYMSTCKADCIYSENGKCSRKYISIEYVVSLAELAKSKDKIKELGRDFQKSGSVCCCTYYPKEFEEFSPNNRPQKPVKNTRPVAPADAATNGPHL